MQISPALAALSMSLILAACGGGGGGGSTAPAATASKAEGVYEGSSTSGSALSILALENDEVYALYGTRSNGALTVSGFDWAQGTSSNGTYTSSVAKDYYYTGAVASGSIAASYVANTSFNGTFTGNGQQVGFTSAPPTNTTYVYNTPAVLSTITGSWSGSTLFGESGALIVSANGSSGNLSASFTGSYTGACTATGTVAPRASGKNVFDISLTFGAAPCSLPGSTVSGIAVSYLLTNNQRQLVTIVTTADHAHGSVFFANR